MQIEEKVHARLGPSGWDRWSRCPGSAALCDTVPNKTSAYAAEGSVAHEIADRVLRGEMADASEMFDKMVPYEGYDIFVDLEMCDSVDLYAETVRDMVGDGILFPEQNLPIGHLTGEPGAGGTTDAIIIDGDTMKVIDLKYGKGVRVNAEGNGQARMYALGALEKFGLVQDFKTIETWIIQPRLEDGISHEVLTIGELEEFRDEVEIAAGQVQLADEAFARNAEEFASDHLNPGEKQCKFCSAAAICPALKAQVSTSLAKISDVTAEDFADLTMPKQAAKVDTSVLEHASPEKLAEFLRAVPLIEAAITAVRAETERRLFAGEEVPGYYLGVGKKGNRAWADEDLVKRKIIGRGKLTKDQAYELKLISPAKAEKLLGKDKIALLTKEGFIKQTDGKPSVCQVGDKNEPYVVSSYNDFADLSAQSEAERLLG